MLFLLGRDNKQLHKVRVLTLWSKQTHIPESTYIHKNVELLALSNDKKMIQQLNQSLSEKTKIKQLIKKSFSADQNVIFYLNLLRTGLPVTHFNACL